MTKKLFTNNLIQSSISAVIKLIVYITEEILTNVGGTFDYYTRDRDVFLAEKILY